MPTTSLIEDVERHPREQDFRESAARGGDQRHGGNDGRTGVADARDETEKRIEPEAKIRAGQPEEVVHDQREPAEERLELLALFFFFRREDFPLDVPGSPRAFCIAR